MVTKTKPPFFAKADEKEGGPGDNRREERAESFKRYLKNRPQNAKKAAK